MTSTIRSLIEKRRVNTGTVSEVLLRVVLRPWGTRAVFRKLEGKDSICERGM